MHRTYRSGRWLLDQHAIFVQQAIVLKGGCARLCAIFELLLAARSARHASKLLCIRRFVDGHSESMFAFHHAARRSAFTRWPTLKSCTWIGSQWTAVSKEDGQFRSTVLRRGRCIPRLHRDLARARRCRHDTVDVGVGSLRDRQ